MDVIGTAAFPRLSRSARILLEELQRFGTDRVIESHHLCVFIQNCTVDFSDRFYLILGELRMKGYIERVGDGYRVISGKDASSTPAPGLPASRDSAFPVEHP